MNPIMQVDLHKRRLNQWLLDKKLPPILKIETLVVFTNPYAILKTDPDYYVAINKVIQYSELIQRLEDIYRRNQVDLFSEKHLNKVEKLLLKNHCPEEFNVLEKYDIPKRDIIKGIYCETCGSFQVKRQSRKWVCITCGNKSTDAHLPSLQDYALIYGPEITNQQLRDFLQIPSISIATNILASMSLPYAGTYRDRVFFLPTDEE